LNISEFLSTLPQDVVKGGGVVLKDNVLTRMFKLAGLRKSDVFCHLGCGDGSAVALAAREYRVKRSIGIEIDGATAEKAKRKIARLKNAEIIAADIRDADLSKATVVLFWFSNPEIVDAMTKKFRKSLRAGARVITVWSPPGMMLPHKVDFPFFVCKKPFRYATSVRQQIKSIYGTNCIDFTASWLLAEKYIDALEVVPQEYRRFVNILQSMVVWINAWNMGVACEDGVPPPVQSYLGILKEFFQIDLSDMFTRSPKEESAIPPERMGCC
jgi:trans-aconitate methyltransferase